MLGPEAVQAALKGTPQQRRDCVEARREAARDRDRRRRRLARQLPEAAPLTIDRDMGFVSFAPGRVPGVERVVEDALALMDGQGGDPSGTGKDHLTTNLLPQEPLSLDSPFIRLALDEQVLAAAARYLGVVPVLRRVDIWHSRPQRGDARSTQLYHRDNSDISQVKLIVHCTDVTEASGPLTVLDAASSRRVAKKIGYSVAGSKVSDEQVIEALGDGAKPVSLTGPAGTAHFVDTSRCFHFGSRVAATAPPRTVAVLEYLTPYAFVFLHDHRQEAPYRHLDSDELPELARLVLGAA